MAQLQRAFDWTFFFFHSIRSDSKLIDYQISPPQELEETRLYYMDVLLKQGRGFARMYVAMRTPSGEMKMPISSEYLVKHITMECEQYVHVERDFHSTNVKMWELSINFILKCLPSDVPGDDCQIEGDSHYPDYVNCKELSDSQKVGKLLNVCFSKSLDPHESVGIFLAFTHALSTVLLCRMIVSYRN